MYWILVCVVGILPAGAVADLRNPHLPWRSILDDELEARGRQNVLCKLPPYPERGGYTVVDQPDARPGDVFQNVSLVQYQPDNLNTDLVVRAYHCSGGEWSKSLFKYETDDLYFNTSWCPMLCSSYSEKNNIKAPSPGTTNMSNTIGAKTSGAKMCILPPYPDRGGYFLTARPEMSIKPGDVYNQTVQITTYERIEGSQLYKVNYILCTNGIWYKRRLKFDYDFIRFTKSDWCPYVCVSPPTKEPNVSSAVVAANISTNVETSKKSVCMLPPYPQEGNYTVVNAPGARPGDLFDALHLKFYCYSDKKIVGSKSVYCVNGVWSDDLPRCVRCGSISAVPGEKTNEEVTLRKELPWHVSIYTKEYTPHRQICSGTIVATNFVVTAAHCVWSEAEGVLPATRFAVTAGKVHRPWDDSRDATAQKSDVLEIIISPKFRGPVNYFKDDIALLMLTTPLVYDDYVSPVCLDFDVEFDEQQLTDDSFGKIASWIPEDEKVFDSSVLQVGWLPYTSREQCVAAASPTYSAYVTADKICAGGGKVGTGLCVRDGGAGLSFQERHQDATRVNFYLRGVLSVTVTNGSLCSSESVSAFTHVLRHETFLKDNLKDAVW